MPAKDLNLTTSSIRSTPGDEPALPTLTPPRTPEGPGTAQRAPTTTLRRPDADPVDVSSDPGAIEYASWMPLRWPCAA